MKLKMYIRCHANWTFSKSTDIGNYKQKVEGAKSTLFIIKQHASTQQLCLKYKSSQSHLSKNIPNFEDHLF